MTFVNITALSFPEGAEADVERRFAGRRKSVDSAEGFLGFELLRPAYGERRYFVVTRWDSREHCQAWIEARAQGAHANDERPGMSVEVYGFEVVQHDE